jgi:hypothetical protein
VLLVAVTMLRFMIRVHHFCMSHRTCSVLTGSDVSEPICGAVRGKHKESGENFLKVRYTFFLLTTCNSCNSTARLLLALC